MALSAAEKQRRYRERRDADPAARAKFLKQQKERYKKDKEKGLRKRVKDMTDREHRAALKVWRKQKRVTRNKQKELEKVLTPPCTPDNHQPPGPSPQQPKAGLSRQRAQADKKRRQLRLARLQKEQSTQKQLDTFQRRIWALEKRLSRLSRKDNDTTPNSKTKKLLNSFQQRNDNSKKTVRRALLFNRVLFDQVKHLKVGKEKPVSLNKICAGEIMKKYKMRTMAAKFFRCNTQDTRKRKGCLSTKMAQKVRHFFERDDVSRIVAGKKMTITRHKVKRQKRLLCDSLRNLYKKFTAETLADISFTTFWRLKPFWVTYPTESDRKTCQCKTCENTQFMADALYKHGVNDTSKLDVLVERLVCSSDQKSCMYGQCPTCANRTRPSGISDHTLTTKWFQWKTIAEERTFKNGEKKKVTLVVKHEEEGTLQDLWEKFNNQLCSCYMRHSFNISNQWKHYQHLHKTLKPTECMIHVDFAENHRGKMHEEIQSMHFGASQVQITLHTGCYYVQGRTKPVTFAGVSDSLQHDPAAIWAFLRPVLEDIKTEQPEIETLHFYSDGPTTQYRQKKNFYLLTTEIFKIGFSSATWNFHESGHGKGIPDGVGAAVKRSADRRVLHGADIMNSKSLVDELKKAGTTIKLYCIDDSDIQDVENSLHDKMLKTVPGTMQLHQVIVTKPEHLQYRAVSCTCLEKTCPDHSLCDFSVAPWGSKQTGTDKTRAKTEKSVRSTDKAKKRSNKCKETEVSRPPQNDKKREEMFQGHLAAFQTCGTFSELQEMCQGLELEEISGTRRYLQEEGLSVDGKALKMLPSDIPVSAPCFPVKVRADGDCLPGSGSVFAFRNDDSPAEMRVRIVKELALHADYYLDDNNLKKGFHSETRKGYIKNAFAMYSDEYVAGTRLNDEIIQRIFEDEVMKISKQKEHMGIWQIFALSNVLHKPIFSAYPRLGNPNVRRDLHRRIEPKDDLHMIEETTTPLREDDTLVILWTSTRNDMTGGHWIPNHFTPCLPHTRPQAEQNSAPPQCTSATPPPQCSSATPPPQCSSATPSPQCSSASLPLPCVSGIPAQDNGTPPPPCSRGIPAQDSGTPPPPCSRGIPAQDSGTPPPPCSTGIPAQDSGTPPPPCSSGIPAQDSGTPPPPCATGIPAQDSGTPPPPCSTGIPAQDSGTPPPPCASGIPAQDSGTPPPPCASGIPAQDSGTPPPPCASGIPAQDSGTPPPPCASGIPAQDCGTPPPPCASDIPAQDSGTPPPPCSSSSKETTPCQDEKSDDDALMPEECLGKYVCINYNGRPYPGFVEDINQSQVLVNCMRNVGKDLNCFFRPRRFQDLNWYKCDDILAVIPEPHLKPGTTNHFVINGDAWNVIQEKING